MNLRKVGQWFDAKSWLGWSRTAWCAIVLVVGIAFNIYLIKYVL